jgi:DNA polymerase-3 subunit delta'
MALFHRPAKPFAACVFAARPAGTGKRHFAERMAKALLCETPDAEGQACGHCGSCGWFDQYSHPDYRRIRPEVLDEDEGSGDAEAETGTAKSSRSKAPSKEIVIHQIRALAEMMNISRTVTVSA